MSSNPLIDDDMVRHLQPGEWNGLVDLLNAVADDDLDRIRRQYDCDPREQAAMFAEELDKS